MSGKTCVREGKNAEKHGKIGQNSLTKNAETYINVRVQCKGPSGRLCPRVLKWILGGNKIAAVAEQAELSKKDAEKALKAFTDVIAAELVKGEKVQLVGFGTFEVSEREAREGRNPLTGEKITIAASKNPKFKAGKALKDMVNA